MHTAHQGEAWTWFSHDSRTVKSMATRASRLLPFPSGLDHDRSSALRHAVALVVFAILVAFFLSPSRRPASSSTGELVPGASAPASPSTTAAVTFADEDPASPAACGTFRAVSGSDAVRISDAKLFHVDETTGLSVVDVSDANHPRLLGVSPFVGMPLALFVEHGIAWVAFVDWDSAPSGSRTVLRSVDGRVEPPRLLGEVALDGVARDVQLSGGVLLVLRADEANEGRVLSFVLRDDALAKIDEARIGGRPQRIVPSPYGLALVGAVTASSTRVSWLELPMDRALGTMTFVASLDVPGVLPGVERRSEYWASVDEDGLVRLVTCAAPDCTAATLRSLDFGGPSQPRRRGTLALGEVATARFTDGRLYVTRSEGASSQLRIVDTARPDAPRVVGRTRIDGNVETLVPSSDRLVVLGALGSEAKRRLVLSKADISTPSSPTAATMTVFGDDATWSPAENADAALAIHPEADLVALPFVTWREHDGVLEHATELASLRASHPAVTMPFEARATWGSRAVFDGGRLLAVGPEGVHGVGRSALEELAP